MEQELLHSLIILQSMSDDILNNFVTSLSVFHVPENEVSLLRVLNIENSILRKWACFPFSCVRWWHYLTNHASKIFLTDKKNIIYDKRHIKGHFSIFWLNFGYPRESHDFCHSSGSNILIASSSKGSSFGFTFSHFQDLYLDHHAFSI